MKMFFTISQDRYKRGSVDLMTEKNIIEAAVAELDQRGESLEDLAGIGWVEDADGSMAPERDLTESEWMQHSIEKLADDGRIFEAFEMTKVGAEKFAERAEWFGLEIPARKLADESRDAL